jgi:D-alanyl-D-alanine dipeptidase
MEAAYAFMTAIAEYPVEECGEPVAFLPDAAQGASVEVVFSETGVGGQHERLFYLRERLVDDFIAVSRDMNRLGWVLKVEDAYRTRAIQTDLGKDETTFDVLLKRVIWEDGGVTPSPEKMLRRLTAVIATSPKIGTHMSGSALDVSVLRREDGSEVERGAPYIELSELTPMHSPFISAEARANRDAITAVMARHGFTAYPYEFWHYSKGDAYGEYLAGSGNPARYGAVDMEPTDGRTTAISSPNDRLHALVDVQALMREALARAT